MAEYYLAVDIGASSGRLILGHLADGKIVLEEMHRFENGMVRKDDHLCWEIEKLFEEILVGLEKCRDAGKTPSYIGVDTWGVDYVLLDCDGNRLGDAFGYRDSRTDGMDIEVETLIPQRELYARTGIQKAIYNTIYQLTAQKQQEPQALEAAETLLFIPDYIHFLLTGRKMCEYTVASTSNLIDPVKKTWDMELISALGLPQRIFTEPIMPGTRIGRLRKEIRDRLGFDMEVIAPASHDTASAVMAIPELDDDYVYICSGTWSLMGIELEAPNCTEISFRHNFTNEGGYGGNIRYLKNIMGLWMIGVDLGTSAVKLLLVDSAGAIQNSVTKEYPLIFPQPGWSEQNPADWWVAVKCGIRELLTGFDGASVAGIGVGGQMHGLVALDENDDVIRPAILWNDGRTGEEVVYLNEAVGKAKLSNCTANIAFAGFTAPKLLWMRKNEPENFSRIKKIMLPKDYVNYMLTGVHCCDYSDASGMLLLDVQNKCWSAEMLDICGITTAQMPKLFESYELIGTLKPEIAAELNIPAAVKVCAGAGDNAAAAVGTGVVGAGGCNISLGTSGTIFISSDKFGVDPNNALHAFAHADGGYHLMGCMLSAASCNKWFCDEILKTKDYAAEQTDITDDKLGRNSVFFLPYLMGERSPINDTDARGTFIGMSMDTTRADMVQAIFEGVAFAIRDSFEVAKSLGIVIERSMLCGGGKSPLWRKIMANVLNIPLDIPQTEEGPGYGGAMLAMVCCGKYDSVQQCADALVHVSATVYPDAELSARYEERYQKFKSIYPAVKSLFRVLK